MRKLFYSFLVFLGLASFLSCFIAEFIKPKKEDVRWDVERNCYIPESRAFGLGTAAILCLGFAHISGNLVMYCNHRTRQETENGYKAAHLTLPTVLLLLSWVSFVVAVLLLSTATSMSRTQAYGEGWLDQECYLVKDGVFAASGCLVLLAIGALIVAATKTRERKQIKHDREEQGQIPPKKKSEAVISLVEEANSITDLSRI